MKKLLVSLMIPLFLAGCDSKPQNNARAVYLLVDTSGTYTQELDKAQAIMNYLLAALDSGDSIAIAKIDSGSFTEKDIIAKSTFDSKPSTTNAQKRAFKEKVDHFVASTTKGSANTDISGGVLQATEYLTETGAGEKYIMIFSDLEEDLPEGWIRDFVIPMENIKVIALNVTKLRSDNVDPREYQNRLAAWQKRVDEGGGEWRVVNDLERLETLIAMR